MTAPMHGEDRRPAAAEGSAGVLHVEPEFLRLVAGRFRDHATTVEGLDPAAGLGALAADLPGSSSAASVPFAAAVIDQAIQVVADRARALGDLAHGTAEDYDLTEDRFTADLGAFGGGS
ncbi:hypothetical protein [Lolliginicoccus suaedae]|uniref:hypothetical protein n=1 Tax=Lolliginicoccus suaedae TaxID=2605429 RepID=UPI0011ED0BC0|nr:hypothetical protein [Lolliginicoccus suaedae]